ncbi:interferon-induced very large GTPase 1-like [Myripristis murdjan]|uniref:interferon-induced very large GTPase 1-like n=1 Tax=Myripristis murdjan TaxID=586833 RepID=UPI00117602B3|nr:interferon-induced very large GTPase 1-like [Myripristis murdjan]
MKNSEEITSAEQSQRDIEALLSRLRLDTYKNQQKLTLEHFLSLGPPVKQHHETSEQDLAQTFLQRLMMLDHRARYILVEQNSAEESPPDKVQTADADENDFDDFFTVPNTDQSKQIHDIHPMDVQMAVFHSSDNFLRQNMVTKLSQCQYALPLLVPDPCKMDIECPLWTLRQIRKSWKRTDNSNNKSNIVTMSNIPIYKAETPMVSFFRLGSNSSSKSQLMNALINNRHNTFFHRNCPGNSKSRYLMDGVAEIAWYCPAGKPNDAFNDCIAFCNLHGDALTHEKQRDILIEKASVNVVLLPTVEKGGKSSTIISALLKSPKPLICLIADNDSAAIQKKPGKYMMGLKDKSQSDVPEELKKILRKMLSAQDVSFKLETMADVPGIRVDENDGVCSRGKSASLQILKLLHKMDVSKIKETFLQCQGQLWHDWCNKNKELYHLRGQIEEQKCQKEQELKQIRQKQYQIPSSRLMKLFTENLQKLSSNEKMYFLKWTGILLDDLSTDDLSAILQQYDNKWCEVLALKKKHEKSDQLKNLQIELEEISTKLQSATFGLEHIFREMGQLYEAAASLANETKRGQTNWSIYPELAAELMISGHPVELLDGDAGHVPLTWISSVFDMVIKKLGDKRVFVLSVLGLQSSGKSTMLNAMFGLQFAVSAGRCTRGAFMQLVKVSAEIQKDFKFDYVLVVDTEGLRALELEGNTNLHHDNELATFVIGLGNLTLVNIFGENAAEMQDILQIVVQAFMRMKKVKLSPSCVFVHQNVTDIGAGERNMEGRRRLQEKLDKMAQLAAKEEDCDAECFSDVIAFDVQKDVKYFAQLWEGSPPMAPPNPDYSESIQELKNIILSKASKSNGMTLLQFKNRILDLWNALQNEHFVFSFKNTLEIAVYRKLEVQYGNWTWMLRSALLNIENQLLNRIENEKLDKVDHSYLIKEMTTSHEEVKTAMKTYFDENEDKEMLAQWQGRFESKIQEFYDEQMKGVKRKLEEVIQQKKARKKLDDEKTGFENKLLQKSKELARELRDKANNEGLELEPDVENQFNSVWDVWVNELTEGTEQIKDIDIEEEEYCVFTELGIELSQMQARKDSGKYKKISRIGNYIDYVTLTKQQHNLPQFLAGSALPYEEQRAIQDLIRDVENVTMGIIKSKSVATRGYNRTYLHEVVKTVKEKLKDSESRKKPFAFKNEFKVDLLLYVCDIAGKQLLKSHSNFRNNNDALMYLKSKKKQYYSIFVSYCKNNSSAAVLAELIGGLLEASIVQAVCNKTAIDLAGEMKSSFPPFSGNKVNLEKHILQSLAEEEDFDKYVKYIQCPRKLVESFIKKAVKKYIFTQQGKVDSILKKNVTSTMQLLSQAVHSATEKVRSQGGNTDMWLGEFSRLLKDQLKFNTKSLQNFSDIDKFDFLKEELDKGLEAVSEKMGSLSVSRMEGFSVRPDEILIDQLCSSCWAQCPFCKAICTNTLEDHSPDDHCVPFHRPEGVSGMHYRGTVEFGISFCTTSVASDDRFYPDQDSEQSIPFKLYRTAGPEYANWSITPDESKLIYWKWFVCRFQKELEGYYGLKFQGLGKIPSEWKSHTKEEAIKSLENM